MDQAPLIELYHHCLETKQPRIMELALFDLRAMVEQQKFTLKEAQLILEWCIACQGEKEETVQVHMIRAIEAIILNYHVHGLTNIFSLLINIHSVSRVTVVSSTSKEACDKIIQKVFQRLEEYGIDDEKRKISKAEENINSYLKNFSTSLVDEVCVYDSRDKPAPLRLVPEASVNYQNVQMVDIKNESNETAGKFGWCVMCRKSAFSYCKDSRVPVCSKECKFKHLEFMNQVQVQLQNYQNWQLYVDDAKELLDMLGQLSVREPSNPQLAQFSLKCKQFSLELIYQAIVDGGTFLEIRCVDVVRSTILETILKNSFSQEKKLFILTLNIFVQLVWYFRDSLKDQLVQVIENVYFKILDSNVSSFDHKQYTLKVFNKIFSKAKVLVEMFVNYDCSVGENNIVERILENQCKIIQGKYSKLEFQALMGNWDMYLRQLALENLCHMILQVKSWCDEMEKQESKQDNEEEKIEIVDSKLDVEKSIQLKSEIQKSIRKFNYKPDQGFNHLIQCGYMKDKSVQNIVKFLNEYSTHISKDMLGEYFGSDKQLNQEVFSEFVDQIGFKGQSIDDGLRFLLEHFTLPGESQQIDRIMQKFASKFVEDNPGSFNSATAAYTLSYLLMMLQTDLHNPQVEQKMKISEFSRLARGINDGEDLPQEALTSLYHRIQKAPLAVHAKQQAKNSLQLSMQYQNNSRKKHDLFVKEAQKGINKIKLDNVKNKHYIYVNQIEYLKPLLQVIWQPLFVSFSVILEQQEDSQQQQQCFQSIAHCIRLLGKFDLDQEKDTFIQYLKKFIQLNNVQHLQNKQILAIHTLLTLSLYSGQYLRKSWFIILQLISQLDQLYNVVNKIKIDNNNNEQQYNQEEQQQIQKLFNSIDYNIIDKIISTSANLDPNSIIDFIQSLCELSKQEIQNQQIFLLSKLVEVADINMLRIKIIWSKIWNIMKEHFLHAGTSNNINIAMYAIDQLKQLSCKFLRQPELANYQFQKDFLQPFEQIYQITQNYKLQLKEFILSCMLMITNVCYDSIKSGWKIIMSIINQALQEDQQQLSLICIQICDKIMQCNLESIIDIYMELIQILIKLTKNANIDIAIKGIKYLEQLIDYIAYNQNNKKYQDYQKLLDQIWIPVLSSLSILYSDERHQIQQESLITLFQLLNNHANQQSVEFWKIIIRGVFRPLFDEIQFASSANKTQLNITQIAFQQLNILIPKNFNNAFFNDLLEIYVQLILSNQDQISLLCLDSLQQIINDQISQHNWDLLINQIVHIIKSCQPNQLFQASDIDTDFTTPIDVLLQREDLMIKQFGIKLNIHESQLKSQIQYKSFQLLEIITSKYINQISNQSFQLLQKLSNEMLTKYQQFNSQIYLRYFLQVYCGYYKSEDHLSGFLELENLIVLCSLQLQYHDFENQQQSFINFCEQLINRTIDQNRTLQQIDSILEANNKDELKIALRNVYIKESQRVLKYYMDILAQHLFPKVKSLDVTSIQQLIYFQLDQYYSQIIKWLTDLTLYTFNQSSFRTQCLQCQKCECCKIKENQQYNTQLIQLLQYFLSNSTYQPKK